ncbi:unnamed protein product [Dicrocoelium dendriticum]|nr:unnamed protein product [Dicrocoelium dendriticum]
MQFQGRGKQFPSSVPLVHRIVQCKEAQSDENWLCIWAYSSLADKIFYQRSNYCTKASSYWGGGGGGTIRDAGDAFGRREAQLEEEYFYRKNREQLEALRRHLEEEVKYRAEEIERHKEAIERHEKLLKDLDKGK